MRCPFLMSTVLLVLVPATALGAQAADAFSTELPPILPAAEEIALARSAAPPEISNEATVMVLVRGSGFEVAEAGTNGVTCVVNRTWPESIEPHCYDPEASRTILRVHALQVELRERGATKGEIDARVDEAIHSGRIPVPERPAVTWMLSAGQVLYNDSGTRVGAWKPHWMIYYPGLTEADLGLGGQPASNGPMLSDAGSPLATIVFIAPGFVEPERPGGT